MSRTDELQAEAESALDRGDAIKALSLMLEATGARCTLDLRRNSTHPCWRCKEPGPHALVAIGTYSRPVGGNILPGDEIQRPLCVTCEEATRP